MPLGEDKMSDIVNNSDSQVIHKNPENCRTNHSRDPNPGNDIWTDGLICAFEFVRGRRRSIKSKYSSKTSDRFQLDGEYSKVLDPSNDLVDAASPRFYRNKLSDLSSANDWRGSRLHAMDDEKDSKVLQFSQSDVTEKFDSSQWVPIGWARISELVQKVQVDTVWSSQQFEFADDEDDRTVADLAAPYWERPAGPIWWCHVSAGHPNIEAWLSNAQWLHPAISLALRDESRLISDRMKHLLYETASGGGDMVPFLLLPNEIIVNILKRLPFKSIVQFRCVCKDWKNLFKTPHFIAQHSQHFGHQNSLLLLHEIGERGTDHRLRLVNHKTETVDVLSIPSIDCFRNYWKIIGSCNGLLCIRLNLGIDRFYHNIERAPLSFCLWNPSIREVREIPQPMWKYYFSGMCDFGFGFSSVSNDFKLLIFYNQELRRGRKKKKDAAILRHVEGEVYSLSTGMWKGLELGAFSDTKLISKAVSSVDGSILWLGGVVEEDSVPSSPVLVSFDMVTEAFTLTPIPITFKRRRRDAGRAKTTTSLGVYDNKFSIVRHCCNAGDSFHSFDIWVMEEVRGEPGGRSFICVEKYEFCLMYLLFNPLP